MESERASGGDGRGGPGAGLPSPALAAGDATEVEPLATEVARLVSAPDRGPEGEFGLVIDQMAILGLGELVLAHPETRDQWLPVMESAAQHMMRPSQRTSPPARGG